MTFERSWMLMFLLVPAAFAAISWRTTVHRTAVILKALMLAAVVLALAEPRTDVWESKVATVVLVDTSAGMSAADLARSSEIATSIEKARGRHWVRVIPFARGGRPVGEGEFNRTWKLRHTAGESGKGTDIDAAVRDGIASVPGGMVPRLVVISDGNENEGSAARAAWLARQLNIPIDTYSLPGKPQPLLRVETVSLPPSPSRVRSSPSIC